MGRRYLTILGLVAGLLSSMVTCIQVGEDTYVECCSEVVEPEPIRVQTVEATIQPEQKNDQDVVIETVHQYTDDEHLLARIAMAEAEGESIEGKAQVICVVLNRVESNDFPDTVYDVIYQEDQFSPIASGRFDRVEPTDECYDAVDMVRNGWDESQGALYFENCTNEDNWHSRNLEFLFKCGSHRFYK